MLWLQPQPYELVNFPSLSPTAARVYSSASKQLNVFTEHIGIPVAALSQQREAISL